MKKKTASTTQITWMKKGGGTFDSTVVLVPMFFDGHLFSVHFVTNLFHEKTALPVRVFGPRCLAWGFGMPSHFFFFQVG